MPTDTRMPQHPNDDDMRIFSIDGQADSDSEPLDLQEDAYEVFESALQPDFAEALEAIQGDSLEPRMLTGFSDMGRNDVRKLTPVWKALPEETRVTVADHILALGQDDLLLDYQRFYRLFLDDVAAPVRQAGASGLSMYEDEELIDPLVNLLTADPDENVRIAAADSLATFTTLGEFGELPDRMVRRLRTVLVKVINDTNASDALRASALAAAAVRADDDEIQDAVEAFYSSGEPDLRMGAVQAMGRSENPRWLPLLDGAVRDPDPDMRQLAARSLAPFDSEVVPMLTMLVREDTDAQVRLEGIQALGSVGGRKALESLHTLREYVSDDELEAVDLAIAEAEAWVLIDDVEPALGDDADEDDLL